METPHLLLFGASGAIGTAILEHSLAKGWRVTAVSRAVPASPVTAWIAADPLAPTFDPASLAAFAPYSAVCWAQGSNATDSVYDFNLETHRALYDANCTYILITLQALLQQKLLAPASRLCVISSIWQNLARQSKLSYCISKAALQGLVLSASVDLAADGHLINAVLPAALATPMTTKNLTKTQLENMVESTKFKLLPQLRDVASMVIHLCSMENSAVTGQFIAVDYGYSHGRIV